MMDVIVTSRSFGNVPSDALDLLERNDLNIIRPDRAGPFSDEEIAEIFKDHPTRAIIVGSDKIGSKAFAEAKELEIISKHGVGVDNVDLEEASRRGVAVTNTPQANKEAVAELAFGAVFALTRRIVSADRSVRSSNWEKFVGHEIQEKTLGIIGLGKIGKRLAQLASSVGMKVLYYDTEEKDVAEEIEISRSALNILFRCSDFVSVHCPLTPDTRGLVGENAFDSMKDSAFLINTARGGIVDEEALSQALNDGTIAGAYLDVFESEPLPDNSSLRNREDVILTPHMAAYTEEAIARMDEVSVENLVNYFQEREPVFRVV